MLQKVLQEERESLEEERESLKNQISAAETRLGGVEERLSLVVALMNHTDGTAPSSGAEGRRPKAPVVEIAFGILSERDGATMHYRELADEVKARGGDLIGGNAAQILVSRLVKDDRFVRPVRRGFYGLRKDYPGAQSVGERKKRKEARVRAHRRRAEKNNGAPATK